MNSYSYFPHVLADLGEIRYDVSFYYTHQNMYCAYHTVVNVLHVSAYRGMISRCAET